MHLSVIFPLEDIENLPDNKLNLSGVQICYTIQMSSIQNPNFWGLPVGDFWVLSSLETIRTQMHPD